MTIYSFGQAYVVTEQFSPSAPTGWSSTSNTWILNYNATSTTNYKSSFYSARFPSAANGNSIYLYIPVNFKSGYNYTIIFFTKRACSVTVNINETANQTTLLQTTPYGISNCASNWNKWYEWNDFFYSTVDFSGFIQIKINTVFGGPASVYLDDVTVYELPPISLPIELLYFKAKNKGDVNHLYWSTASEINNDYFTIEKSYNGFDFYEIDRFDGSSYSINQINYEFIDTEIKQSIVYYKLKQTDYDGKFKYSDVISVDNRENNIPYILKRIDVLGKEVKTDYNGLIFNVYSDGKVTKVNNINY